MDKIAKTAVWATMLSVFLAISMLTTYAFAAEEISVASNPTKPEDTTDKTTTDTTDKTTTDTTDKTTTDTTDKTTPFTVPEEQLSAENYLDMHSYGILQLNGTIQSLGDDEFTHPTSREILKREIREINDLVKQGGFYTAYNKLLVVKKQMDGSIGGSPDDDEIKEESQGKVLPLVDERFSAFAMSTTPAVGVKRESPDDIKSIITTYGPWILGAIALAAIAVVFTTGGTIIIRKVKHDAKILRIPEYYQSEMKK